MVVQCCVCKKVRQDSGRWARVSLPTEVAKEASHGYCPKCAEAAYAEIRRRSQVRCVAAASPA